MNSKILVVQRSVVASVSGCTGWLPNLVTCLERLLDHIECVVLATCSLVILYEINSGVLVGMGKSSWRLVSHLDCFIPCIYCWISVSTLLELLRDRHGSDLHFQISRRLSVLGSELIRRYRQLFDGIVQGQPVCTQGVPPVAVYPYLQTTGSWSNSQVAVVTMPHKLNRQIMLSSRYNGIAVYSSCVVQHAYGHYYGCWVMFSLSETREHDIHVYWLLQMWAYALCKQRLK